MVKTEKTDRSSNVSEVSYNDETAVLTVGFKSGGRYEYSDVPEKIFESMVKAPSVGKYFLANVKNNFRFRKV